MFRLQRNKAFQFGEKIEFSFSNFQATQVPKGWDKLYVTIISSETGKSIIKSSKASVRNGRCQWTDTLSESIWISEDDISKKLEEKNIKLVVATGFGRLSILGEATVNVTEYASSTVSAPVSLPLKKCNYGTILKFKVNCLTPIKKFRNESKDANYHAEDFNTEYDSNGIDIGSNGSDSTGTRTTGSSSSSSMNSSILPGELWTRESSFSTVDTSQSCDSAENSLWNVNSSPGNNLNGDQHSLIGRQDSNCLQNVAPQVNYSVGNPCGSNNSSSITRVNQPQGLVKSPSHDNVISSLGNTGPTKGLSETTEDKIEELLAESKVWEGNAHKTTVEVDISKKEFSDHSQTLLNMKKELLAACAERDESKKEVEQLKLLLRESKVKQTMTDNFKIQGSGVAFIQEELEKEIKYQQESSANLAQQLEKSQESNIELVSVLQELEETIQKQKIEIENTSALQLKIHNMEFSMQEKLEENRELVLEVQHSQELEKNLRVKLQSLEQALEDKIHEIENGQHLNKQCVLDVEEEYNHKLSAAEEQISILRAQLSDFFKKQSLDEKTVSSNGNINLIREIESLKEKVEELERDCNELTEENLELLIQLKESKNNSTKGGSSCDVPFNELPVNSFFNTGFEAGKHEYKASHKEEELENKFHGDTQLAASNTELFQQLQMAFSQVKKPWYNLSPCFNSKTDFDYENLLELNSTDAIAHNRHAESIFKYLVELNSLLEARISDCERVFKQEEVEIKERDKKIIEIQTKLDDYITDLGVEDMQSRLSEALEECSSFQKLNGKLGKQRRELHDYCLGLESELMDAQKDLLVYSGRVDDLQTKLASTLEGFDVKENRLSSELDALLLENKKYKEQLVMVESFLNQMYMEKTTEAENLQREVAHLTNQISTTCDERERVASEAADEVKSLQEDKKRLESALEEVQFKVELTENKLHKIQNESETKIAYFMNKLATSEQELEKMKADHENILDLLERSSEEKLKTITNNLEGKLSASENERQLLLEETANLKVELQKTADLHNGFLVLEKKLSSTTFEKEKLEELLDSIARDCEDMRAENAALTEKISDLEDCKQARIALEEKLLHLECDLAAREALQAEDVELKKVLSQIKGTNVELQKKIQQLEDEKDEYSKKAQVLREELKLTKEKKLGQNEASSKKNSGVSKSDSKVPLKPDGLLLSKNELVKNGNQHRDPKKKASLNTGRAREFPKDQQNPTRSQNHRKGNTEYDYQDESSHAVQAELVSKVQLLENELADALEANNAYKSQLKRLLSEGEGGRANAPRKSTFEGAVAKESDERTKSSLEAELRDIRERYLHMSLKYAQVESEREELMMKLKETKNGRRWFS